MPTDEFLRRILSDGESSTIEYRLDRSRFIWAEFGPPANMLLVGGVPAMFAVDELKRSFIYGNFMATVLLAQVFVEQSIGGIYLLSGDDEVVNKGFSALIDATLVDEAITSELAESLHDLRRMRNPYTHNIQGAGRRSYMGRLLQSDTSTPEDLVVEDAKFAINVVVDFIRHGSPKWNPDEIEWNEDDELSKLL